MRRMEKHMCLSVSLCVFVCLCVSFCVRRDGHGKGVRGRCIPRCCRAWASADMTMNFHSGRSALGAILHDQPRGSLPRSLKPSLYVKYKVDTFLQIFCMLNTKLAEPLPGNRNF